MRRPLRCPAPPLALVAVVLGALGSASCDGPPGPEGKQGAPGTDGPAGAQGCAGLSAGQSRGLVTQLSLSTPANKRFFVAGEQPVLTVVFKDRCGQRIAAAALRTADLFLYGPRDPSLTATALKMLNAVSERPTSGRTVHTEDEQHHFVSLISPRYALPSQNNKAEAADGTISYTFSPVTNEPPGTYTVAVWTRSVDYADQDFALLDLQIGTADVEEYTTGSTQLSTCLACHTGTRSGRPQMAHSRPSDPNPLPSPLGNRAVDASPIAGCKACHNLQGFSEQPLARKIHALHRGRNQAAPGVAHPEYGAPVDPWLVDYTDVTFPSMPAAELDCVMCHVDDRWKSKPSRFACGGCHENLFFDSGVMKPARTLGKVPAGVGSCAGPASCACKGDADCAPFGMWASCAAASGLCVRAFHQPDNDDLGCKRCHSADDSGDSPTGRRHDVLQRSRTRGLQLDMAGVSGGSGAGGVFQVGDVPVVSFRLKDRNGTVVSDLLGNAALSGQVLVGGPTDDPQRLAYLRLKGNPGDGALSFDAPSGLYTYRFAQGLPAQSLPPWNTDPKSWSRQNRPGTYSIWVYVNETLTATRGVVPETIRDAASAMLLFRFGDNQPLRPRQLVLKEACATCHARLQAHGGTRQVEVAGCALCHTAGAVDRTVGSTGASCRASGDCGGFAGGWEECRDTNADGNADTCVITRDPTPGATVYLPALIHSIHFARLRSGYGERDNLVLPGKLALVGFNNSVSDLSDGLLPVDIRNCTRCHADSGATCDPQTPCGVGQRCENGTCVNGAWTGFPSGAVCLACHDSGAARAHAALQTWTDPQTGAAVESCDVCHGPGSQSSVSRVHEIVSPYAPPYDRKPAP